MSFWHGSDSGATMETRLLGAVETCMASDTNYVVSSQSGPRTKALLDAASVCSYLFAYLRADEVNVGVHAAGRDNHPLACNHFRVHPNRHAGGDVLPRKKGG